MDQLVRRADPAKRGIAQFYREEIQVHMKGCFNLVPSRDNIIAIILWLLDLDLMQILVFKSCDISLEYNYTLCVVSYLGSLKLKILQLWGDVLHRGNEIRNGMKSTSRYFTADRDFYLGLPRDQHHRVARIVQPTVFEFVRAMVTSTKYLSFMWNIVGHYGQCEMCISAKYPSWLSVLSVSFCFLNQYYWRTGQYKSILLYELTVTCHYNHLCYCNTMFMLHEMKTELYITVCYCICIFLHEIKTHEFIELTWNWIFLQLEMPYNDPAVREIENIAALGIGTARGLANVVSTIWQVEILNYSYNLLLRAT